MRYVTSMLAIAAVALALTACTGKSSSQQSNTTTSSEASAEVSPQASEAASPAASDMGSDAMTSEASASPSQAAGSVIIPDYPGAAVRSRTDAATAARTNVMGRVLVTPDAFDKVYTWYQGKMPAGSERVHLTQPLPSALFVVTDAARNQDSVNLTVNHGKTVITIAHVVPKAP